MNGKVVLVMGATSGLGLAAAEGFARLVVGELQRSAPSRIINVSSGGMYAQKLRVDDLQSQQDEFDGAAVYARSKRAEVILTELWSQRPRDHGIVVHSMHPGWADTPGVKSSLPRFYRLTKPLLRSPAQAPTRSSGSAPPPRRRGARAGSSTTARPGLPTCSPGPGRPPRTGGGCGTSASA